MTETTAFSNKECSSDDIEAPETMNFEALSPAYKTMLFASTFVVVFTIIAVNLTLNLVAIGSLQALLNSAVAAAISGFVLFGAVLSLILPKPMWRSKGYQLREHDVHYRRGIIWRRVVSLPYVRVQHVQLESGPVERYFKLATLKFYTAGGGSADMSIPGLPYGTASKIRAYVIERTGVGDESASQTDEASGKPNE